MDCPKCQSVLIEEARNWGSVVICPGCGFIKPGQISRWARANMEQPRPGTHRGKADSIADAMGFWPGASQPQPLPTYRQSSSPDDDAAAEEADIATWGER